MPGLSKACIIGRQKQIRNRSSNLSIAKSMKRNKREGKGDNLEYVVKKRLFEQLFQKKNLVEGSHTECLRKDHSWLRKFLL